MARYEQRAASTFKRTVDCQSDVTVTGSLTVEGNTGIGTTSPTHLLTVYGDISGSGKIFNLGGIETVGNIGVTGSLAVLGTTTLYDDVEVDDDSYELFSTKRTRASSAGWSGIQNIFLNLSDGGNDGDGPALNYSLKEPAGAEHTLATIAAVREGSGSAGKLKFATRQAGGSLGTKMVITNSGSVGIGTQTPNCNLHVAGAAAFSGPSETFVTFSSSDATPSVATGNLFKTHASGQTLTMFDDGVAGQIINVISTAAVVYDVTGTNLKGGSADITTADGDVTTWVFDGTNWYLLNFMDVSADLSGGH